VVALDIAVYSNNIQVIKSEVIATSIGNNIYNLTAQENMKQGPYLISIGRVGEMPIAKNIKN